MCPNGHSPTPLQLPPRAGCTILNFDRIAENYESTSMNHGRNGIYFLFAPSRFRSSIEGARGPRAGYTNSRRGVLRLAVHVGARRPRRVPGSLGPHKGARRAEVAEGVLLAGGLHPAWLYPRMHGRHSSHGFAADVGKNKSRMPALDSKPAPEVGPAGCTAGAAAGALVATPLPDALPAAAALRRGLLPRAGARCSARGTKVARGTSEVARWPLAAAASRRAFF